MLEFIVLGQIPGTHIVLSFGVTALVLAIITVLAIISYQLGFSVKPHVKRLQKIIDISL